MGGYTLRDDGNASSHIMQSQLTNVHPIDRDHSLVDLGQPQQGHCNRRLASSCAPDNANALSTLHLEAQILQHRRQPRSVPHAHTAELHRSTLWPWLQWHLVGNVQWCLVVDVVGIVHQTLHRIEVLLCLGHCNSPSKSLLCVCEDISRGGDTLEKHR